MTPRPPGAPPHTLRGTGPPPSPHGMGTIHAIRVQAGGGWQWAGASRGSPGESRTPGRTEWFPDGPGRGLRGAEPLTRPKRGWCRPHCRWVWAVCCSLVRFLRHEAAGAEPSEPRADQFGKTNLASLMGHNSGHQSQRNPRLGPTTAPGTLPVLSPSSVLRFAVCCEPSLDHLFC